jgi:predicted nucleotidyltransferase
MTWRVPPFDRAVDELVAYVRATYAPIGIVISGSIVRGEAGPLSDLDVFVVHDAAWRLREQRRFAGVPAELFVNPASKVRGYFQSEHADGRPCTAHMFATGEAIEPVRPAIAELVREAREWMTRPLEPTEAMLALRRYGPVDVLDDARDVIDRDPVAAALLLAEAVRGIVAYAFWRRRMFQPRRKTSIAALAAIDPDAAELVRVWSTSKDHAALAAVTALAKHVLEVDTFFEWTSARDPVT